MSTMSWQTTRFLIDLTRPQVMGIVNLTPDSFSDGGQHAGTAAGLAHCERLVKEGAHILDIGGESSRPGAPRLSVDEEWQRVEGVLRGALTLGVPVSIDTCKAELMRRAADLGVDILNDILALRDPGAEAVMASHPRIGACLMHMRGDPGSMQSLTDYADVVQDVAAFLGERTTALRLLGVQAERIVLDPGYGFAKTVEQNFELLRRQQELLSLGYPILAGLSRKSAIGAVTGRTVDQRLPGSLAAALLAYAHGARILRVHDVAATLDALQVWGAGGGAAA